MVIFLKNNTFPQLTDLYVPFNYRFLLVKKINNFNYELTDVHQIGVNGSKIFSHFTFWDENKKFEISRGDLFSRRMNLKGHIINIMNVSVGSKIN